MLFMYMVIRLMLMVLWWFSCWVSFSLVFMLLVFEISIGLWYLLDRLNRVLKLFRLFIIFGWKLCLISGLMCLISLLFVLMLILVLW